MTRDDRPTSRDREQTQPDGIAARADDMAQTDKAKAENSGPNDSARKPFDPWRFGFHTVSAEHRREQLEMQLPETPAERLFDPTALDSKPDASSSAPPALTVDAAANGDDGTAARKADTLRLRRGPPLLANPLRTAAPWAAGAALIAIALLWLLTGGNEPKRSTTAAAPLSTTSVAPRGTPAPPQLGAGAHQPSEREPVSPRVTTAATEAAKPAVAAKRSAPPKAPPAAAPALTPSPSPAAVAQPPATKKPPDDDASPFGTWTAPPRD